MKNITFLPWNAAVAGLRPGRLFTWIFALILAAHISDRGAAQSTVIQGVVSSPQGPVPGVTLLFTSPLRGTYSATTAANGQYGINLPNIYIAFLGNTEQWTATPTYPGGFFSPSSFSTYNNDVANFSLVSSAPTLSDIADQTIHGGGARVVSFTVADYQTAAGSLTVTVASSNPALIPVGNVVLAGTTGSRTATITTLPSQGGSATLTFTVRDGENKTASDSFVVTVPPAPLAGPSRSLRLVASSGQSVRVPNFGNQAPTTEVTIEFWQKVDAQIQQSTFILSPDATANRINAHVPWADGTVYWDFGNLSAGGRLQYVPAVSSVGVWTHWAFVASQSGNYMKIFRNGVQEATKTGMSPYTRAAGDLILGTSFSGNLADFRVWNVARSEAQIANSTHTSLPPGTPGLILNYHFNEPNGFSVATTLDAAASSAHPDQGGAQPGTLVNGPLFQANDATLAAKFSIPVVENSPTLIYLPARDLDTPGFTYSSVTTTQGSIAAMAGAGASSGLYVYTPPLNFSGAATIAYTVSDTYLTDSASVTVNVVAVNDPPVVGPGASLALNGSNQYLDLPDGTWFENTFTVEGWVFMRSYASWSRLFDFSNGGPTDYVLGALSSGTSGQPSLHVLKGSAAQFIQSSQAIPLNVWTHLAFTRDSGGIGHIYLNGVETAAGAVHAPNSVVRVNNYLGRSAFSTDAYANARLAEVRIWNTARTATELATARHASLPPDTSGLITQYRLNEGSGTTAFDTATGDGVQNATLVNSPTWQPVDGPVTSVALNGTSQYATVLDSPAISITGPITLEAWIRPAAIGIPMGIVEKYDGNDGGYILRLNGSGRIEAFLLDKATVGSDYSYITGGSVLTANVWSHVAARWDGTRLQIYVNGVLDAEALIGRNPKNGSTPLTIGATGPAAHDYRFNGRIGDVRIWNVARTAAEIANWRDGVPANAPGLVANYRFAPGAETLDLANGDGAQNLALVASPVGAAETGLLPRLQLVRYTEDVPITVVLPAFDMEGAALTYSGVTASSGTLALVSTGRYTYTPAANYNGPATIDYTVSDGTTAKTATVYLLGIAVEDPPTMANIPTQTIGEGSATTSLAVTFTDGDPELTQALTVTATSSDTTLVRHPVVTYTSPLETAQLAYKPRPGRSGSCTITVVVFEPVSGLSTTRTFTLDVMSVDDPPNVGPATALQFNGNNSVEIAGFGNQAPVDEITLEFWQKATASGGSPFFLSPDTSENRLNAQVPFTDNKVYWDFGNSGTAGRLSYTPPVNIVGSWQHFAFVASKSGNYMKIFRNGIEEATKPGMTSFTPAAKDLILGSAYNGSLAEFRVWNRARTAEEIFGTMHSALTNNAPGLVAYYRFNQRPTLILKDFASAGDQGGAQDGVLIPDGSDNDPIWQTTTLAAPWQSSDADLNSKQIIRLPDGASTNVFLPAFDAESGLTLAWQEVAVSTGAISGALTSGPSTGIWTYTAPVGYDGPATISYKVRDAGNPAVEGVLNLRVFIAQNDAPTIARIPNVAAEENTPLIEIPFTVGDDQPEMDLTITPVLLANSELIQSVTVPVGGAFRSLNIVPKPGEIGTVRIRLIVLDAGQKTAQTEFDLRIEPTPAFAVFDLGVVPGKSASFATGINDRGAVTGYAADTADLESNPVGFFFNGIDNGGVVEDNPLIQVGPLPLALPFRPYAINNTYALAGAGKSGGQTVAWFKGIESNLLNLGVLAPGNVAEVRALNEAGSMVGWSSLSATVKHAFRFAPGDASLTDLGTAPAPFNSQSQAFGLNAGNQIVGSIFAADGRRRAMLWEDGVMRPLLNIADDTNSVAYAINTTGEVVGSATVFSTGDSALSFDGSDDTVSVANLLTNPDPGTPLVAGDAAHTVEAWVRVRTLPGSTSQPLLLGDAASGQSQYWQVRSAGDLEVGFNAQANPASVPLTLNSWMHVATTYDPPSSTLVVYLNGDPLGTNIISGVNLQGIPLVLGAVPAGGSAFSGALDEVRVWRTTRTAAEIAANYTRRLSGEESGLVLYLPFSEGSGTATTASLDRGGLSATLSGGPEWTVRGGLPSPEVTVADAVLQLDGASSYADLGVLPLANTSLTLEFRARRAAVGAEAVVLAQGTATLQGGLRLEFKADNKFRFEIFGSSLDTVAYTDLEWHHWACTLNVNSGSRRIYRDGVLVASDTIAEAYIGAGNVVLGRNLLGTGAWFKGLLDDVRIWNLVRTGEEIAAGMNLRLGGESAGLLSSFTFDEGGGNTAVNRVATAGPASLQGAIGWAGRDSGSFRAFLYETGSGRLTSLGTLPGGDASEAKAINDFGQIVGNSTLGTGNRAFFYSAGQLHDLHSLLSEADQLDQWTLETAAGINRSGAVVGTGSHRGLKRAYLALPATLIGRPVIRPQGAVERYPQITLLKKHLSDDTVLNSFYWSFAESKLYAIRPVTAKIEWYTSFTDIIGSGSTSTLNTSRVVSVSVNVWPKQPVIHIAGAPVDLQPAVTGATYTFQELRYVTNNASVEPSTKVFSSTNSGYSVAFYLKTFGASPNPLVHRPYFEVIRTVDWQDSHAGLVNADGTIGTEVVDPDHREYGGKNGYVLLERAAYDAVGSDKAYDRGTRQGPILPVNTEKPGGNLTANPDPLVVVWYRTNRIGVAWGSVPIKYGLNWPSDATVDRIVIASQLGSGLLSAANYPAKTIYTQPDITLPGFNPNEEHAYMPVDVLFAIRNDLNEVLNYSQPYALLKFQDPGTGRWRMRVFKVVAEADPYYFTFSGTVGKEVQPPLPLSLMPLCSSSLVQPRDSQVGWEDHKGKVYARMAGPEGSHTNLVIRWFYPMQPGFFHPEDTVAVGDCLPWLDRHPAGQLSVPNSAKGIKGVPIDVTYDIRWDDAPVLRIGETLIHSKNGLPDVFNMANARVIFDSLSPDDPGGALTLTRFYDPISERTLKGGVNIPTSLKRQNIGGKEYFTDLPWMLKLRLSYDPINKWLSFKGYLDENFGVGEPLLLPNVLSARERDRIKQLADGDGEWASLIGRLYDLTRNPNGVDLDPADGLPDAALRVGLTSAQQIDFFTIKGTVPDSDDGGITTVNRPVEYTPTTLEDAIKLDAKLIVQFLFGGFNPDGGVLKSSFSFRLKVVPEPFGGGPKALTAGVGGVSGAAPKPGNALSFDGTGGRVTVGQNRGLDLELNGTPFTIEFWAKVPDPATEQYLVGQPGGSADLGQLRIGFREGGKFAFDLGTTPASVLIFNTGDPYTDDGWHHWACVFNPETKIQTIFRDGISVAERSDEALTYAGSGALQFGGFGAFHFTGQLDEVRIWKTARTGAQIRGQMNKRLLGVSNYTPGAWPGSEQKLELLYRCDEEAGPLKNGNFPTQGGYAGSLSGGVTLVASTAPTGIPPRYITLAENDDAALAGLPVSLYVMRIDDGPFLGDLKVLPGDNVFDERLTLRHSSDFGGDPGPLTFQWYYKSIGADFDPTDLPIVTDPNAEFPDDMRGWTLYQNYQPKSGEGVNFVTTGEGGESGLVTLSDNAFVSRYRGYAVNLNTALAWSGWVGDPTGTPEQPRAALAEGWVKRVIRGLNPFDARTADFHSSPSVTFASMLIQLGQRYEGPIAFNPSADAINKVGLIEAYTTVLERAKGLSIDGVPQVNFNPANNALLLAATKLSDFYMVLGNEAYADASDPTIGFGSGSVEYGSLASSIFAFQNQLDSPLEEELTLLRGRDDSAAGVAARPIYNRLFWNFTLGEGEVAYQENYGITDQDRNGFIDEKDARILYPQGHGDAWGHYLAATKQQYALMRHPFFTWIPRTELVSVAGAAVKVDFLDERKFALAAAAKAKVGAEIVDLTYRLNYVEDPAGQWQGYKDTKTDRAWGVTEWARRAGMATYLDWLTGNTILPSTDPNPNHTGIDKIDRQTVRELHELPTRYNEIQTQLDEADAGLNPLGLAKGVVPFDIDPSLVGGAAGIAGKTHYEQIQDRALKAMANAVAVWDEVNKGTQSLRKSQDGVEEFTQKTLDQERDYKNRLIEIFGYPYAGDIGASKTYPSGYDGPDLYHYMYVPVVDLDGGLAQQGPSLKGYFKPIDLGIVSTGDTTSGALGERNHQFFFPEDFASESFSVSSTTIKDIEYPKALTYNQKYYFSPPAAWGQRRAPGELQLALSDLIQNEARLKAALKNADALLFEIDKKSELLTARYAFRAQELSIGFTLTGAKISILAVIVACKATLAYCGVASKVSLDMADAIQESVPTDVGFSTDGLAPARGATKIVGTIAAASSSGVGTAAGLIAEATEKVALPAAEAIAAAGVQAAGFEYEIKKQISELEVLLHQLGASTIEARRLQEQVGQSLGRYQAASAKGQRLLEERVAYRIRVAGRTTQTRYQDMTFRIFRSDALQKYRATFDLAQRYVFLAATAYDYESNLLGTDSRGGREFLTDIIRQRSLGQLLNGQPVVGRTGLADPLARMSGNFDVLKPQLGFNNPQTETGRFSLRNELFRLRDESDEAWRSKLTSARVANLWDLPEFRRYCRSFAPESAGPQPGLVIRFPTTVTAGQNFFTKPLGGGDSAYDSSRFATKVRSVGVWFSGYNGLGLSQTPRMYLIPAGADILASPTPNDFVTRAWRVVDQALPVPFAIGVNQLKSPSWIPVNESVGGSFAEVRRFASFRAYHDSGGFDPNQVTSDSRLIGRSVWNTDWVLIIPGQTFLANANTGLDTFINSVDDIKLFFQTYSYSGN